MPDRGNFDCWSKDPQGGGQLNLASLDIIQRRNHILRAAMDALPPTSRQLLSTLALLSESVDYETLTAFNPHLPPEPKKVEAPEPAAERWHWYDNFLNTENSNRRKRYKAATEIRKAYVLAMKAWQESEEFLDAPAKLGETIKDLEQRGLLQYDGRERRYDLHPVVRGVAAGGMQPEDKERYGQRVVDHFASRPHSPYEQAKSIMDLEGGLYVVRTLLKLGHHQRAADAYWGDLATSLRVNLEAYWETLSLLRPFFQTGWGAQPKDVTTSSASYLLNEVGIALSALKNHRSSLSAYETGLRLELGSENWYEVRVRLSNISKNLSGQNLLAKSLRAAAFALDLATGREDDESTFKSRLNLFADQSLLGLWPAAEATWGLLDPMRRDWHRAMYRQGNLEYCFALFQFWQSKLKEEHLTKAAVLAEQDGNRTTFRRVSWLRGAWRLEQGEWALAAASFSQAVTMAREVRLVDKASEPGLALAKFHLGQLTEPRQEAERLAQLRQPAHRYLAMLWHAIGDSAQAKHHALAAYKWAWADGEPYVHRYELTQTTALLQQLGVPIPQLPPYDPAKDEPFPWEADVRAAIEKLRKEKEEREAKKKSDD